MTGGALALSMRTEGRDECKDEMHGRFCQLKAASGWRSARNWVYGENAIHFLSNVFDSSKSSCRSK
jgi:hypothetical protein